MPPEAHRLTGANYHAEERAADPYLVTLVTASRKGRAAKQSENINVVADELAGTAVRRRTILLNSDS